MQPSHGLAITLVLTFLSSLFILLYFLYNPPPPCVEGPCIERIGPILLWAGGLLLIIHVYLPEEKHV